MANIFLPLWKTTDSEETELIEAYTELYGGPEQLNSIANQISEGLQGKHASWEEFQLAEQDNNEWKEPAPMMEIRSRCQMSVKGWVFGQ